jgi:NAD(P)H-hydrate epimerase
MQQFNPNDLKQLYVPQGNSHKGQNGKLLIIGGSQLFHAASLWALQIASRIVDMVFYSSVIENNQIVHELKKEFRNGIVVPRDEIENYVVEADAILIGPGMVRTEVQGLKFNVQSLKEINQLEDEGLQSYYLTKYLLKKFPNKKWVIDAGALQMMEPEWLLQLNGNVVITPHPGEFERVVSGIKNQELQKKLDKKALEEKVELFVRTYNCIALLKGESDIVCSPDKCVEINGGNAGMTKGGTGDVLAGLVAALSCNNDTFLAACAGSYFNKKAGEALFEKVGYYFNASDLADEIPVVMKKLLK